MSGVLAILVTGGMVATVSPTGANASGSGVPPTPLLLTTNSVTVSVQGGNGPYTYAWANVAGTLVNVTSPTAATTTFSKTEPPGKNIFATYRCTVTDSRGRTASVDVPVAMLFLEA